MKKRVLTAQNDSCYKTKVAEQFICLNGGKNKLRGPSCLFKYFGLQNGTKTY